MSLRDSGDCVRSFVALLNLNIYENTFYYNQKFGSMQPEYNLDRWRKEITAWLTDRNMQVADVVTELSCNDVHISQRTRERRLKQWDISGRPKAICTKSLKQQVIQLFFDKRLNDSMMLRILKADGHLINSKGLIAIRKDLGL
ncbi:hypothetical protein K3495_g1646 [Podosphaera aphanis]|nr:hypothetical protein K3495_g1646 [Podosphaera aphanis]